MIAFIEDHKVAHGVEPICRVLPVTLSTFHAHAAIARDPDPASDRARQDVLDRKKIKDAFDDSGKRYGARKIWHELRRNNHDIARCTVERLMKAMGIKGVVRGQKPITTNPDRSRPCPDDKVRACRVKLNSPDRLNVLCFANAASKYTERLAEADIDPSVGSVGNDNTVRYKRCATNGALQGAGPAGRGEQAPPSLRQGEGQGPRIPRWRPRCIGRYQSDGSPIKQEESKQKAA